MNQYAQMIRLLKTPAVMKTLTHLYGQRDGMLVSQTTRYTRLIKRHEELIGSEEALMLVSAPGRTEIVGNHTDHNRGKVLAAAVNLDTVAAVNRRKDQVVRIFSDGYAPIELNLAQLEVNAEETGTTTSLVRGVAKKLSEMGMTIGGFDAVVNSTVSVGSGLSSSAAFEVMLCAIFDALYNGWKLDPKERAMASQYAENVYFGKPSGLMDQMASSVGGLTYIDFKENTPKVKAISYDFAQKGYALVVVNVGSSHDDLTADYAAIPAEMAQVADCFGEKVLRRVRPEQFLQNIAAVREKLGANGDRALLRAAHYFTENTRVADMADALQRDDLEAFRQGMIASGRSSYMYLQNVYAQATHEELCLALMLAEERLCDKGAWRVHGGGFAGTTLNLVPQKELDGFVKCMESVFGVHSCNILDIRPEGAAYIDLAALKG